MFDFDSLSVCGRQSPRYRGMVCFTQNVWVADSHPESELRLSLRIDSACAPIFLLNDHP